MKPAIAFSALMMGGFIFLFLGNAAPAGIANFYRAAGLDRLIPLATVFSFGHAAVYAALTLFLSRRAHSTWDWTKLTVALTALGIGVEVAQEILGGRAFEIDDLIANQCGIGIALYICCLDRNFPRRRLFKKSRSARR